MRGSVIDRAMNRSPATQGPGEHGVPEESQLSSPSEAVPEGADPAVESAARVAGSGWLAQVPSKAGGALEERRRVAQQKLGDIMIMLGILTTEDRDRVLTRQEKLGIPFGECCLRLKLIKHKDLSRALAWQFGDRHPESRSREYGKELVVVSDPFGAYAEALRSVGVKLMSRWVKEGHKAIAIVSAGADDGRSHVTANLAVSLALAGWRTLLIDADLRRPRQHEIFNLPQHPGLSRLLCGFAPKDVVRHVLSLGELSVITSGPLPPNAIELFSRKEFSAFLRQAEGYYDVLLIDTPGAGEFPDVELIASAAGSALIVVQKNESRERDVQKLVSSLGSTGVEIAGTIMNEH